MKRFGLAALLALSANLLAQAPAPAPSNPHPYSQLYVFGDSYSDSGSGYVDGNGPTAVVYFAQRLGIPFTWYGDPKSTGKGLNFAISGAADRPGYGRRYPTGEMLGIGMRNQVDEFVTFSKTGDIPKFDPAETMFFFAGGLNDRGKPEGYTRTNIESEIDTLYDLGARRFTVALLPTKIPPVRHRRERFNPELVKDSRRGTRQTSRHPHRHSQLGRLHGRGNHPPRQVRPHRHHASLRRPHHSPRGHHPLRSPRRALLLPRGPPLHRRPPRRRTDDVQGSDLAALP